MTHLFLAIFVSLASLLGGAGQDDQWPNKPQLPLRRTNPVEYRIGLGIDIGAAAEAIAQQRVLTSTGGSFTIDFVTAGNWTLADPSRLTTAMRINGIPTRIQHRVNGKQGDETYSVPTSARSPFALSGR
jgi:hypothetical protein